MGDLSNLLGDVYGDDDGDGDKDAAGKAAADKAATNKAAPEGATEAAPQESGAPEWSADERLDEAFAEWSPGPPPEAPDAERKVVEIGDPGDGDLHEALAAALAQPPSDATVSSPAPEADTAAVEPVAATAPVARPWQRSDDDILPAGRRRRGFRLR